MCTLPSKKIGKFLGRILRRKNKSCTIKEPEKIIGNLVFASWVIPFGRSFISHISFFLNRKSTNKTITLDKYGLAACEVWSILLKQNRGLSFDFVLGKLPRQKDEWFVDASPAYGYGGVCGNYFFKISHKTWISILGPSKRNASRSMFIAYRELLAVLFAFHGFAKFAPCRYIRVNSDNTNTVNYWLNKGRCPKKIGFLLLSAIQFYKAKYTLRTKAHYIKSDHNTSADGLSRGRTPQWLKHRGRRIQINIKQILKLIDNPVPYWKNI